MADPTGDTVMRAGASVQICDTGDRSTQHEAQDCWLIFTIFEKPHQVAVSDKARNWLMTMWMRQLRPS